MEPRNRRSIRLKGYDYSQPGAYFITICTQYRKCSFGDIVGSDMQLNAAGRIVADSWQWLARQYDYVVADKWVIMPNHIHGILLIVDDHKGGSRTISRNFDDVGDCRGGSRTALTGQRSIYERLVFYWAIIFFAEF